MHAADIGVWLANRFHLDPTVGLGYRYRMMQLLLRKKRRKKYKKVSFILLSKFDSSIESQRLRMGGMAQYAVLYYLLF